MYYDVVDNFGDQCIKEVCIKVVINLGIDSVWSQCRMFCNGIIDVCCEERYYQC